jgi:hypothetical protein
MPRAEKSASLESPAVHSLAAERAGGSRPGAAIGRIDVAGVTTRRTPRDIEVEVVLEAGATSAHGRAAGPNTRFEARRVVGHAALEALCNLVGGDPWLSLGEIEERRLGRRRVLLACVIRTEGRAETAFLGSSEIRHEPEHAVVHAILDAVGGWVATLPPREPVEYLIGPDPDTRG